MNTIDGSPEQLYELAGEYGKNHQYDKAEEACRAALNQDPQHLMARFRLANSLDAQDKREDAVIEYEKFVKANPGFDHGWNNYGSCLLALDRYDDAAACFRKAIAINPGEILFTANLALALTGSGEIDQSMNLAGNLQAESGQEMDLVYCLTVNALAFRHANRPDLAEKLFQRTVEILPDSADNHVNLGLAQLAQNHVDEAVAGFEKAIELDPENTEAHWSLAGALLLQGDYQRGWPLYEWRWQRKADETTRNAAPAWEGEPGDGRVLLITAEQGIGDIIQFIRFLPALRELGWQLRIQHPSSLTRLLSVITNETELLKEPVEGVRVDRQVPIGSIPGKLEINPDRIPAVTGYLDIDDTWLSKDMAAMLSQNDRPNVGLVWKGNPRHVNDRNRSIALEILLTKLSGIDANWYSLQKGQVTETEQAMLREHVVRDLAPAIGDFADTAAIVSKLDCVVTVDTSVAHLVGALGKPGVVLLPFAPDWRWGLEGEKSPWYNSLKLVRQADMSGWQNISISLPV